MDKKLPIYKCSIDSSIDSLLEVDYIALVDSPAIERNFIAFNKERMRFNVDDKKKIISGPVMIADMLIYRNMEPLGEFYTVFDKESIATIVQKFFKKGYVRNFNFMHDEQQTTSDITIFESFITDKERGINAPKGYEDVADGSWFITAKVDDETAWANVENGTFKGFSVEGLFKQIPVKAQLSEEQILERIAELLSMI